MTLTIGGDWEIIDNRETITVQNKNESSVTIQNVCRRSSTLDIADASGNAVYAAGVAFIIWKANAPSGFVPRLNALVTDYLGKKYYIDSINDGTIRTRWHIRCTSETNQGVD